MAAAFYGNVDDTLLYNSGYWMHQVNFHLFFLSVCCFMLALEICVSGVVQDHLLDHSISRVT